MVGIPLPPPPPPPLNSWMPLLLPHSRSPTAGEGGTSCLEKERERVVKFLRPPPPLSGGPHVALIPRHQISLLVEHTSRSWEKKRWFLFKEGGYQLEQIWPRGHKRATLFLSFLLPLLSMRKSGVGHHERKGGDLGITSFFSLPTERKPIHTCTINEKPLFYHYFRKQFQHESSRKSNDAPHASFFMACTTM